MYRVTGANSRRTKVEIGLSVDTNGDYCFDEDDKPIPGREPIVLELPRFNYMPWDELKQFLGLVSDIEKRDTADDDAAADLAKARELALAQLRPFVGDDVYTVLDTALSWGELQDIINYWGRESNTALGESSASNGSPASTRGPSKRTSSATV